MNTISNARDDAILEIKRALEKRSGKKWSVTGGRGTAWGWIQIDAPPKRRTWSHRLKDGSVADIPENYEAYDSGESGRNMSPAEQAELATLMGYDTLQCSQGISVPASSAHYREYIERAQGKPVTKIAEAYWD